MTINRRNFLINSGLSLAAGTLFAAGQSLTAKPAPKRAAGDFASWESVRAEFDALAPDFVHLSSFFLVSHPRTVRAAIEKNRRALDENPLLFIEENIYSMPLKIQTAAAEYLGGKPEEVALTNSTTMGLAFVYQGLPLKSGQEILTTAHDHFVHHEAIRLAAERAGASVRKIALFDDAGAASETEIIERLKKSVAPKTRIVGVTWVHSSTGVKLPIRQIADALEEINRNRAEADRALLVVDGVHGFGACDEPVAAMGADFFVAGAHKWLFGPRGTGIVWAREENWRLLRMVMPAFAPETVGAWMSETQMKAPMRAALVNQGGFRSFEYEWALPAAFEFHQRIGRRRVAERIGELNDQCKEGLAKMKHVRLYTPRGRRLSAGLVCFDVEGMKAEEVVRKLLAKRIVASASPYKVSYARLAPSLVNSPADVDAALREIRALA